MGRADEITRDGAYLFGVWDGFYLLNGRVLRPWRSQSALDTAWRAGFQVGLDMRDGEFKPVGPVEAESVVLAFTS